MYRIILSLHVISVISWMAGILYLIRLFAYHAAETESVVKTRFIVMEKKLLNIITLPASIASLIFGLWMLSLNPVLLEHPWMKLKLGLAICLLGVTHWCSKLRKDLEAGTCHKSSKYFRVLNEVPTLIMIAIVFLAILKPW